MELNKDEESILYEEMGAIHLSLLDDSNGISTLFSVHSISAEFSQRNAKLIPRRMFATTSPYCEETLANGMKFSQTSRESLHDFLLKNCKIELCGPYTYQRTRNDKVKFI